MLAGANLSLGAVLALKVDATCEIHCLFLFFIFLSFSYLFLDLELGICISESNELFCRSCGDCRGPSVEFVMCCINSRLSF